MTIAVASAAQGASSTTLAWFTLAGALGGVFFTSLFGLVVGILNHRWQARGAENARLIAHGVRIRDERRESYAGYWLAWNKLSHELRRVQNQIRELTDAANPVSYWRGLAEGLAAREEERDEDEAVAGKLRALADEVGDAELGWRTAADVLLLVAGPAVARSAKAHIALTDKKIDAAWHGQHHSDPNGAAYRSLNDAMQADLLSPGRPDQWRT